MWSSLLCVAAAFPIFTGATVLGVPPHRAALYKPITSTSPATWKCINSSEVIPFSAVNDDFCDCPDGTDEPGTSACAGSVFYCPNKGHIGAIIPGSRVNDGLCEPECCDGSDEPAGVCPNKCAAVGEEYRKLRDAKRKVQKTGAKIRGTYIAFAKKEQKRLEESIDLLEKEVAARQKDVDRLHDILERTESISHAAMEHRKGSPLYTTLLTHSRALKSLQKYHKELKEKEKTLSDILRNLKNNYNPNYHDMAVLEAVRGWDEYSGEGPAPEATETDTAEPVAAIEEVVEEEEEEEGMWTPDQLEWQLDGLLEQDYQSLLVQHDDHIAREESEEHSSSYIPEAFSAKYEIARSTLVGWLRTLRVIRAPAVNPNEETNHARQAYNTAESSLQNTRSRIDGDKDELKKLFAPEWYGREGEWRKLKDTCLSFDTGEYVYEVCLFGSANQKQKNGGSNFLGSFSSWNTAAPVGSPAYYSTQYYKNGLRCWNGPERSVTLKLECGTENVLHSVSEPEKCEYHLTGTTPALCSPVIETEEEPHVEL